MRARKWLWSDVVVDGVHVESRAGPVGLSINAGEV
jgi:hypothetical protein